MTSPSPLWGITEGACDCPKGAACASPGKHPAPAEYPNANPMVRTEGDLFVIDLDRKPGKDGFASLSAITRQRGTLPRTRTVRTGSGGLHIYLRRPLGVRVPNSAGKLGPGIDVRGDGGYVVGPGALHASGKRYEVVDDSPIAPAPAWALELVAQPPARAENTDPDPVYPPASPAVLEAAADALDAHGPAVEGDAGDLHTFKAGALVRHDFALTEEEAWPLLVDWNETCQPPWPLEDLAAKMRGGAKYATGAYGCRRSMDSLTVARKLIGDWRDSFGKGDPDGLELLNRVRALRFDDPAKVKLAEFELSAATRLGSRALALPKAVTPPRAAETGNWAGLDLSSTGAPVANLNNVVIILEREQREIGHDTFLQKIVHRTGTGWQEWGDADDLALTLYLQRSLGLSKMPPLVVSQAVTTYAHRRERNSVRESLEAITWDGVERIASFFTRAFGAEDNDYTRAASSNWWRSLVARVLEPGVKVDTMPVFEGAQGLKKSSALRVIAGQKLFAEASESPHSKDFFLALVGKLIVEIAEMDAFSRAEVTAVKRVLSCSVDRFRAPYERATRDWPRQGTFAGTTNRTDWARDDTGGRRFWPITCTAIDLDLIKAERKQLFAEAVASVKAGATWWDMPQEATAAAQEARRQGDPWEEALSRHFEVAHPKHVTINDLLSVPIGLAVHAMGKPEQMRVASILKRLGFERVDGYMPGKGKAKFWTRRDAGNGATP